MVEFNPLPTRRPPNMGSHYVEASGHYLASMAGIRILEIGGNVVDAGVAAGLCINVLQPDMTNIGGVDLTVLSLAPPREVVTISGPGRWTKAATLAEIRRRGGDISCGILSTVVPSALDVWIEALYRYGTVSLATLLPSVDVSQLLNQLLGPSRSPGSAQPMVTCL